MNSCFTICSLNYLHYALCCRESFLKYNSDKYTFTIFLMDMPDKSETIDFIQKCIKDGIDIKCFYAVKNFVKDFPIEEMLVRYNILEINTAVKPFCMEYLFKQGAENVMYIDPDIKFYQPIDEITKALKNNDIVLTPHMSEPYPCDGKMQCSEVIMQAGIYNCGFAAVKNSQQGLKAVKFWQRNLIDKCYSRPEQGLFTDQKWADWFPSLYNRVYILKNKGYNAAYWNLHERVIEKRNGVWYANDDKLVFYHFSGLNRKDMEKISKYQNRYTLSDRKPDLKELFEDYLYDVNSRKADVFCKNQYFFNYLPCTDFEIKNEMRAELLNQYKYNKAFPFAGDKSIEQIYFNKFEPACVKTKEQFGINIIGYINNMHSIGEIARGLIQKNFSAGIPFSLFNINCGKEISEEEKELYKNHIVKEPVYPVNISVINADSIENVQKQHPDIYKGRYNAGIWFWEFESGFEPFLKAFDCLDEIIVCSDFILNTMKKYAPHKKITKLIIPVIRDMKISYSKEELQKEYGFEGAFTFFFNFDYNSSYDRKNPEAILKACSKAFQNNENFKLVIKTSNAKNFPDNAAKFNKLAAELNLSDKIIIIDEFLSEDKMMSLINACSAYISLHRGEGAGMGMIEAMMRAKPVIASNYGGNTDFMNKENSLLVNYTLVKPETDFEAYKNVKLWAEPDINEAAAYMLKLYNDRNFAQELGLKAQKSIMEYLSSKNWNDNFYEIVKQMNAGSREHPAVIYSTGGTCSSARCGRTSLLENIFSVKNDDTRKIITFFGAKLKIKSNRLIKRKKQKDKENRLEQQLQNYNNIAAIINNKIEQINKKQNETAALINNMAAKLEKPAVHSNWNIPELLVKTLKSKDNHILEYDSCIETDGVKFKEFESYFGIAESFGRRDYEFGLLNGIGNCVFIDAGANIGDSSLYAASRENISKVYAYEPFPNTFKALQANLECNPGLKDKVEIFQYGWSDEDKTIEVNPYSNIYCASNSIDNSFIENFDAVKQENLIQVKVRKSSAILQEILNRHENQPVVLKLDIEGSEYAVLNDLDRAGLLSKLDIILLEWHYKDYKEITDRLEKNGFVWFNEKFDAEIGYIRAVRLNSRIAA